MKGSPKFSYLLVVLLAVFSLVVSACGPARSVVNQYHKLIEYYQGARKEASNFRLCVDTAMGTIFTQATFLQGYQKADVEKARVWREALDNSAARLVEALANYRDADGNPIPADKLDLAALAQAGALPNNLSAGFAVFVQAFQEAPLAQVSDKPVLAAMATASEQYNKIEACGTDWNDAVALYNVERNKIPGDVVGRLAEELGVKELPQELPYYQGDYEGGISQPRLPAP